MKKIIWAVCIVFLLSCGTAAADVDIYKEVTRLLIENYPWKGSDIEVNDLRVADYKGAEKFDDIRINMPRSMRNLGKVSFSVEFLSQGKSIKSVWASAHIKVYRDAVVALNPMKINQKLTRQDVTMHREEITDMNDAAASIDEVEGMLVKRPLTAGSIIKKECLKPEIIIKRGDRVAVRVESSRLRIKSTGTATEDGYLGGMVNAKTASGREISGKVAGPDEIVIEF